MPPDRLGAMTVRVVTNTLLASLFLAPLCSAQSVVETPQQANDRIRALSSVARSMPHDYVVGNGDLLDIEVFDVKELSREVRISQTGTIGIPLVPVRLHVAGLTEIQVEQKIAEVLEANGLVSHPEVSVSIKERKSKPITVVGAVSRPLVFQADRQVTLLEVLAEAGGISNDAGDTVIVTRPAVDALDGGEPPAIGQEDPIPAPAPTDSSRASPLAASNSARTLSSSDSSAQKPVVPAPVRAASPSPSATAAPPDPTEPPRLSNTITVNLNRLVEDGDATNNLLLEAGDIVTVPHAGIVYILGSVTRPGGYVLANDRSQMTTLKILALSGGLNNTAKLDHAVIIRRDSQGQQHEVPVDLRKVQKRQTEDVQLHPSDILYVPNSGAKQALLKSVEFGIALGSGVALYRLAYR